MYNISCSKANEHEKNQENMVCINAGKMLEWIVFLWSSAKAMQIYHFTRQYSDHSNDTNYMFSSWTTTYQKTLLVYPNNKKTIIRFCTKQRSRQEWYIPKKKNRKQF